VALLLGGCNLVFGLDPADRTDAAVDAPVDADEDSTTDASLGTWGVATTIGNLATANVEEDPFISSDGLELYVGYLAPASPTGYDIVVSRRVATNQQWPPPVRVAEVSGTTADWTPKLSADGKTLYLSTDRVGTVGMFDTWRSMRASSVVAWSLPEHVTDNAINTVASDRSLMYCLGGTRGVLTSDRNGGQYDLYELVNGDAQPIAVAAAMGVTETAPWVSEDCLTVYFTSNAASAADFDLYVMSRRSIDDAFDTAVQIEELATTAQEIDPWVSADGRHIVFASDRGGTLDIWEAVR
jgi:hypothetical protein